MPSTYSTNLKIELIATGEQSGTWGSTTNTNLGTLLEEAIAGYVTQAVTDGAATVLTIPNGTSSNGRNYVIELTGALTANRVVEVPAVDKPYIFFNNTTGGFSVTVRVSGQTGVTIANGKRAIVYTNSIDVIEVVNAPVSEAGTQTLTNKTLTSPTLSGNVVLTSNSSSDAFRITQTGAGNALVVEDSANPDASPFVVTADGRVGVGTTVNTNSRLRVADTTDQIIVTNGTNEMTVRASSTEAALYTFQSIPINFYTANQERMRITNAGDVVIGAPTAARRFTVSATGTDARIAVVDSDTAYASALSLIEFHGSDGRGGFAGINSGSFMLFAEPSISAMTFTAGSTERMRIDSSGNVGIGTASPAVRLAVSSTDAILVPVGTTGQRPTGATGYLRFNTTTTSFEGFNGTSWGSIGGGAAGGGSDAIFYNNGQTVTTNYSIPSGQNAGTFGPITINSGVTVTVPSGSTWSIV